MAKYDWEELRKRYLLGDYGSLKAFAAKEGLPYGLTREKLAGVAREKRARDTQKTDKIIERTTERQIEREVDRNVQHLRAWDRLMRFIETFEIDSPQAAKTLAEVLERAQKGQRLALGLDKKEEPREDSLRAVEIVHTNAELSEAEIEELLKND